MEYYMGGGGANLDSEATTVGVIALEYDRIKFNNNQPPSRKLKQIPFILFQILHRRQDF